MPESRLRGSETYHVHTSGGRSLRERLLRQKLTPAQVETSRLKAGCTVESPAQPVENTLSVATGRLPIGRRLPTCPTILRWAFIRFGGPKAHEDSQDWPPHKVLRNQHPGRRFLESVNAASRSAPQVCVRYAFGQSRHELRDGGLPTVYQGARSKAQRNLLKIR